MTPAAAPAADPAGVYFDRWAVPPPSGDWEYVPDGWGVVYAPGWWPFSREHWSQFRVSPGTAERSWRNEYVLLRPRDDDPAMVEARLTLWVRPRGHGGMVVDAEVRLDLRARTFTLHGGLEGVREQAETKAARLLAFVLKHRAARRAARGAVSG